MEKPIHKILCASKKDYEMLRDDLFIDWADENSLNIQHLQAIISNQSIYAWFNREYDLKEKEFKYTLNQVQKENPNVDLESIRNLYDQFTSKIRYYPKALVVNCIPKSNIKIPKYNHLKHKN